MNTVTKIFNKIIAHPFQQHTEGIIHHDQVGLTPEMTEWFTYENQVI